MLVWLRFSCNIGLLKIVKYLMKVFNLISSKMQQTGCINLLSSNIKFYLNLK